MYVGDLAQKGNKVAAHANEIDDEAAHEQCPFVAPYSLR